MRVMTTAGPRSLRFEVFGSVISGDLTVPDAATGVVLFARASGSSRASASDRRIADDLHGRRFATVLLDLFTREELLVDAMHEQVQSDVNLLAARLVAATDSVSSRSPTWRLPLSYFAEGTGAAAAIIAAAVRPSRVWAVVSVSGHPDRAGAAVGGVVAPTLLIVGHGDSNDVKRSNENAFRSLRSARDLVHVNGESGRGESADEVARLTADWLARHIGSATPRFETRTAQNAGTARNA